MFNEIKTREDIEIFLDKTNALHDGYILGVQYANNGIYKIDHGHYFDIEKRKLVLQILVTSLWDAIVEIEFEGALEWQIKDEQMDMTNTAVLLDENGWITWIDDVYISMEEAKKRSYVIARSMRWRIVE